MSDDERSRQDDTSTCHQISKKDPHTKLTETNHLILHASHFLTIALTTLFLILPATSGPGTGFFWVKVGNQGGSSWSLGGLGDCQDGTRCGVGHSNPVNVGVVRAVLEWHFAAGAIFFVSATCNTLLIFFPTPRIPDVPWITFLLPFVFPITIAITVGVDFRVIQELKTYSNVGVTPLPCFYLNIVAFITVMAWVGLAQYIRWLGLQVVEIKPPPRRRPRPLPTPAWNEWLNPWSEYNRKRQANG